MTLEERVEGIDRIARILNGAIDVPGISDEVEQVALVFLLSQAHAMSPSEDVADSVLSVLLLIPAEMVVKVMRVVLPDFLETIGENEHAETLRAVLSAE